MITKAQADRQMTRLLRLRNPPDDLVDVLGAMCESSRDEPHASRITDHLLRNYAFFPTPHDVYQAAAATQQHEEWQPDNSRKCRTCYGTGYRQVWVLKTSHANHVTEDLIQNPETVKTLESKIAEAWKNGDRSQMIYSGVKRCPCAKGQGMPKATAYSHDPEAEERTEPKRPTRPSIRELPGGGHVQ